MPEFKQAVEMAENNHIYSMGIHLNLTQGRPISPSSKVPSLIDHKSNFLKVNKLLLEAIEDEVEIEIELREQIAIYQNTGLKLTHIDSHQSVHMRERFSEIFIKLANELKVPLCKIIHGRKFYLNPFNMLLNRIIWYISTDSFSGDFYGNNVGIDLLKRIIQNAPNGITEIMTHPAFLDDDLNLLSSYNKQRETELEILTSKEMIK